MFRPLFSSVAIKLCSNVYALVLDNANIVGTYKPIPGKNIYFQIVAMLCLDHANIMGFHKLMPGENIIFPVYMAPKNGHKYLKCP